jgi:peptidyl-prolyl cis-trans isomerase C
MIMKRFLILILGVAAAFSACSGGDKVIARIGKSKITVKSFQERLNDAPMGYKSYLETQAGKKQFLDLMMREKLVLEAAHRAGMDKKDDYKKLLARFKQDQERRLKEYQEGMLMELFIRDLYDKELTPSEQDIEKYYNEHKEDFARPVEVTARHILVSSEEEANKALARVKAGENFAKVAQDMSNDAASAAQGGKIGPFKKGDLVPDFETAVFSLKNNQLSGVVKTQFGFHVIQKLSEKALTPKTLEQSKADIKKIIEKGKFDAWMENTKKKFNATAKYELLDGIKIEQTQMPMQMMGGQPQAQ